MKGLRIFLLALACTLAANGSTHACETSFVHNVVSWVLGQNPYNTSGASMFPTFETGQVFWSTSIDATKNSPKRGDIATFCLVKEPGIDYVKRVIGLPGDHVRLVKSRVVLNGIELPRTPTSPRHFRNASGGLEAVSCFEENLLDRKYEVCQSANDAAPASNTPEYIVPAGSLFVLGDNRDNSNDSRFDTGVSYVPLANILGIVHLNISVRRH